MQGTLLLAGLFAVPVGLVYVWIGRQFDRRQVSRSAQTAIVAFSTWWYALGAFTFVQAFQALSAAAGLTSLNLFVGFTLLEQLVLVVALWGLLVYLLYLWWGTSRYPMAAVTGGYLGCFLAIAYLVTAAHPVGVDVQAWTVDLAFAHPPTDAVETSFFALLTVPQILGALAYLSLWPRVDDPTRRYRVLLVSAGVLTWFGAPLAGALIGLDASALWPLAVRALGLLAALVILAAYRPPEALQRRLGVRPLGRERAGQAQATGSA